MDPQQAINTTMMIIGLLVFLGPAALLIMLNSPISTGANMVKAQETKHIKQSADYNLSETSVEHFSNYSQSEQIEIAEALKQGARFGKYDLGKFDLDLNTGRIIG